MKKYVLVKLLSFFVYLVLSAAVWYVLYPSYISIKNVLITAVFILVSEMIGEFVNLSRLAQKKEVLVLKIYKAIYLLNWSKVFIKNAGMGFFEIQLDNAIRKHNKT